jgi:hypothetical protein
MSKRHLKYFLVIAPLVTAFGLYACGEAPPKIAAIPPGGLAIRLHVFGASAQEAHRSFEAVNQNNPTFHLVKEGGDGEVVVGLENDSPKCVPPTALCSYKIAYRIRDKTGSLVYTQVTNVSATSEHCSDLCSKALNNIAVKVVELASAALKNGNLPDASTEVDAAPSEADAAVDANVPEVGPAHGHGKKPPPVVKPEPPPPPSKPQPVLCSVGSGPRLASEDAEKRAAQIEVLKRIDVLDQEEYDCLRKAYLDRL